MKVELELDDVSEIVRNMLLDDIELAPEDLVESLHRVIAYYSVPGTYCEGKYDTAC